MALDRVGVGDDLAGAPARHQAARRPLLIGHGDGAEIGGPAVAVAGIEGVVGLTREIGQAGLIEARAVVAAEAFAGVQYLRIDPGVQRIGLWREEEARIRAHLVGIDQDLGPPVADQGGVALGFRLGLDEPVAVQVEQVVVIAARRPGLGPFRRQRVGVGLGAQTGLEAVDEAVAPVGVLGRDEDDHGVLHPALRLGVGGVHQAARGGHGGVGGADLVAVHRIGHPDDDRGVVDEGAGLIRRGAARIAQRPRRGLDLIQPGDVGGRADGGPEQGAAFPGRAIVAHDHAVGRRGAQDLEIAAHLGGTGDARAGRMAQDRVLRRGALLGQNGRGGCGQNQAEREQRTRGDTTT
ncbi:hypothetical protein D3C86_1422130 [compost metagenome]